MLSNRLFRYFPALLVFAAAPVLAQVQLPEGKGKEILDNYCQECHGMDEVMGSSRSSDKWRQVIVRMVRKGATLKPEETEILVEYLTTYFGPDKAALKVPVKPSR